MTMKINKLSLVSLITIFLGGCSLSPGMHMTYSTKNNVDYVYIESIDKNININQISDFTGIKNVNFEYKIGKGDQVAVTIWGLPEIFPINAGGNADQNLRRVDSNGNIYFPYVGLIKAEGKNQNTLRNNITEKLSAFFTEPQVDVSVARFNSQKIYLLGEVTQPMKINITDVPITLAHALGEVKGLNTNTASGTEVYIIRQLSSGDDAMIFKANLDKPSGFIEAGNFYMQNNDIVYVNAKGTTRWNRVISQFFPFSTFLNSIDNLVSE